MIAGRWSKTWQASLAGLALFAALQAQAGERRVLEQGALFVEVTVDDAALAEKFGPRFDRSGSVTKLRWEGQEFVHPWGLADEFGLEGDGVLGYDEAGVGGTFLKIGVGELRRLSDVAYFHSERYPVVQQPALEVVAHAESVRVRQTGRHENGYAYAYEKTYRITAERALEISYSLRNSGTRAFTVRHYNHNFLRFGDEEPGVEYRVETRFGVRVEVGRGFDADANLFVLRRAGGGYLSGRPATGPSSSFTVSTAKARLRVEGDFPPVRFAIWVGEGAFSPEVFGEVTLAPAQTAEWRRTYQPEVSFKGAISHE